MRFPVILLGLSLSLSSIALVRADEASKWNELSNRKFLDAIAELRQNNPTGFRLHKASIQQASNDRIAASQERGEIVELLAYAEPSPSLIAHLASQNSAPNTFDQLRAEFAIRRWRGVSNSELKSLILEWTEQNTTSDVSELAWMIPRLTEQEFGGKQFTVRWAGQIRVPAAGAYQFSHSLVDSNVEMSRYGHQLRTSMKVRLEIDGKQVLSSDDSNWNSSDVSMRLAKGKLPFFASMELDSAVFDDASKGPFVKFYWSGPGISKKAISAESFVTANESGVEATYQLGESEFQQIETTPGFVALDPVGLAAKPAGITVGELSGKLASEILASPPTEKSISAALTVAGVLSQSQLQQIADWLRTNQSTASRLSANTILDAAYSLVRIHSPEASIEVAGEWLRSNPDLTLPSLLFDASNTFREDLDSFGQSCALRYPVHLEELKDKYLRSGEKECNLAVAHSLSYGFAHANKLDEWKSFLDSEIGKVHASSADISWFLARAHAEQLKLRSGEAKEYPLAGKRWLDIAINMERSRSGQIHALRHLISGYLNEWSIDEAKEVLRTNSKLLTSSELSALEAEIDNFEKAILNEKARREGLAERNSKSTLERRLQKAIDRGDKKAADSYKKRLNSN